MLSFVIKKIVKYNDWMSGFDLFYCVGIMWKFNFLIIYLHLVCWSSIRSCPCSPVKILILVLFQEYVLWTFVMLMPFQLDYMFAALDCLVVFWCLGWCLSKHYITSLGLLVLFYITWWISINWRIAFDLVIERQFWLFKLKWMILLLSGAEPDAK